MDEWPAAKLPVSILVVVHTQAGEVLLMERIQPPGWWQSVTGSLEPGETLRAAAVRELAEETGLAAEWLVDLGLKARFTIAPEWRHRFAPGVTENLEHAFALRLDRRRNIRLNPAEHTRCGWLPFAAAIARATSVTDRAAIEHVRARLQHASGPS
jgi:dihydroneopterin triphosphate diphosphatase